MYSSYLSAFLSGFDRGSATATMHATCPFRDAGSMSCSASVMRLVISKRQDAAYCSTDNHDCCPVFLGKVLRTTRAKSLF